MVPAELLKFIKAQKVLGKDDSAIRADLAKAGWQADIIEQAYTELTAPLPVLSPTPSTPINPPQDPKSRIIAAIRPLVNKKIIYPVVGAIVLALILVFVGPGMVKALINLAKGGKEPAVSAPLVTETQLNNMFRKAINSKELEFNGLGSTQYVGCQVVTDLRGIIYGENKHFKHKISFKEGASPDSCLAVNATESYSEGYWIEDDVFYRNSETDSLAKIIDATESTGQKPTTFLTRFFGEGQNVKIISSSKNGDKYLVKVSMDTNIASQDLDITADSEWNLESISYVQDLKGFPKGEAVSKGTIKFLKFTLPVALPPFAPTEGDFLRDAFVDITSFSPLDYSVDTVFYSIHPGKTMLDGAYSIEVVRGDGAEVVNCYLNDERCLAKLAELTQLFNLVTPFIDTATAVTCEKKEKDTGSDASVGGPTAEPTLSRAEEFGDRLTLHIFNKQRSGPTQDDYNFFISIYIGGDKKNQFMIRTKLGQEYCFSGGAGEELINDVVNQFNQYQASVENLQKVEEVVPETEVPATEESLESQ